MEQVSGVPLYVYKKKIENCSDICQHEVIAGMCCINTACAIIIRGPIQSHTELQENISAKAMGTVMTAYTCSFVAGSNSIA